MTEKIVVKTLNKSEIEKYISDFVTIPYTLKLVHWHETPKRDYAVHMVIDKYFDQLIPIIDSIVEIAYATYGDLELVIPQQNRPTNVVQYVIDCISNVNKAIRNIKNECMKETIKKLQEPLRNLYYTLYDPSKDMPLYKLDLQ